MSPQTAAVPTVGSHEGHRRGRSCGHPRVRAAFTTRDPLDGVTGTPTATNPYHYADNDPLNKIDPTGLRPSDIEYRCFGDARHKRCPVVIDDVSETFRAQADAYERPSRSDHDPYVATDSAYDIAVASQLLGIDTRMVFGIYLQETSGGRTEQLDRLALDVGDLGSVGASNLPYESFASTVRRNPMRFGAPSNSTGVMESWLRTQYGYMVSRDGKGPFNLAFATASRVRDIYDDLLTAIGENGVISISREKAKDLPDWRRFRLYRESALIGQAYFGGHDPSVKYFNDVFTESGGKTHLAIGDGLTIEADGSSGYSNGLNATCSTSPFRC